MAESTFSGLVDSDLVIVERPHEGVAHVVLNRPHRRNALTGPLADELGDALEALNHDDSVHVIVLRGEGNAFCSGLDLKEFGKDPQPEWVPYFGAKWRRVHRALFESQAVIIGALERAAVNGGAALALACDFLVVGDRSFLQVGEVQQGMAAPMNMAWLRLRFSESVAGRLALLGDRVGGPELVRLGVAYQSVPDDKVVGAAQALAERMAAHDPNGVRRIKVTLRRTTVTETADEWFAKPLNADPMPSATVSPVAATE